MDDQALGWAIRSLRHARGWRQADLAARAGVSRTSVWLVEHGHVDRLTIRTARLVAAAAGLTLRWDPGPAPALGRARDADHARLAEATARMLTSQAWAVRPEVSYSRYGERGRIDLLAWHAGAATLLVLEVKTVIVDVQRLLGDLDAKTRLAPSLVGQWGWAGRACIPALVVAEGTTNRRRLREHAALFARFGMRGRTAVAWLRRPVRPEIGTMDGGLLLLIESPNANHKDRRRAGRARVRLPAAARRQMPAPTSVARDELSLGPGAGGRPDRFRGAYSPED
jgi:transcriptional regulator with XRE-family HTH domain